MKTKTALGALSALAHERRLSLFQLFVKAGSDGLNVTEACEAAGVSVTTGSAQIKVLAQSGLLDNRRDGRTIYYNANYDAMRDLMAFMLTDCCQGRAEILNPLTPLTTCC